MDHEPLRATRTVRRTRSVRAVHGQLATAADAEVLEVGMEMELVLGPLYTDDEHEYVVWQWAPAATKGTDR